MQTEQFDTDFLSSENSFVRASTGKRFLNYFIDLLVFSIIFFIIGIFLTTITPVADELVESDSFGLLLTLIYALYMSMVEASFKGKSIGKLLTKTRAVNLDGTNISTGKAFSRGFIRVVPFCALSAFGNPCNPWQDRWTNTMVIDEEKSVLI